MYFAHLYRFCFFLLLLLCPFGLGAQDDDTISQEQFMTLNERLEYSSSLVFLDGMKFFILEEYDKAVKKFEEALRYNPQNSAAHYQLAQSLAHKTKFQKAIPHAREATRIDAKNPYYWALLAAIAEELQLLDEAEKSYKTLIAIAPRLSVDYYYELANLYVQQGQPKKAIEVLSQLETHLGTHERLVGEKQNLLLSIGKFDEALQEGQKLIDAFPNEPTYQLAQIEMLFRYNKLAAAQEMLRLFDSQFPNSGEAHYLRTKIYKAQGDEKQEQQALEQLLLAPDMPVEEKVNLLLEKFRHKSDKSEGLEMARQIAQMHPEEALAQSFYADFLIESKNYSEAQQYYLKAVELNPDNYLVWERIVLISMENKAYQEAFKHSENAIEVFPNQARLWYYQATALSMMGNLQEALETIEQGLKMVWQDKQLASVLETKRADIFYAMQLYDKAFATYEKALSYDNANYTAMNNYSYYSALEKRNLKRAKDLSANLIALFPQNPDYLDTHAWVLYQSQDYKQAKVLLEKAVALKPSATILEHYGDTLFQLGLKEQAREQWIKAQELTQEPNPVLENKIAQGKI
jgi:tetratricopeptide (TPR) repeat protein